MECFSASRLCVFVALLSLSRQIVANPGNLCVKKPVTDAEKQVTWVSTGACKTSGAADIVSQLRQSVASKTKAVESTTNTAAKPTPVRLVEGETLNQGRVEVFYNGSWGRVCVDLWCFEDADVVCRMLGYNYATGVPRPAYRISGQMWLDDVQCTGEEVDISSCRHKGWGNHVCDHGDATVICDNSTGSTNVSKSSLPDWSVRLADGNTTNEGRVEVLRKGVWGRMCDGAWKTNPNNANVVCRMLGFERASDILSSSLFVPGSGPLWINYLACYGRENNIRDCRRLCWNLGLYACTYVGDSAVRCV